MTSLPLRTTTTAWTLAFGHCARKASSWQSRSASRPTSAWLAMVQPSFNATGAPHDSRVLGRGWQAEREQRGQQHERLCHPDLAYVVCEDGQAHVSVFP